MRHYRRGGHGAGDDRRPAPEAAEERPIRCSHGLEGGEFTGAFEDADVDDGGDDAGGHDPQQELMMPMVSVVLLIRRVRSRPGPRRWSATSSGAPSTAPCWVDVAAHHHRRRDVLAGEQQVLHAGSGRKTVGALKKNAVSSTTAVDGIEVPPRTTSSPTGRVEVMSAMAPCIGRQWRRSPGPASWAAWDCRGRSRRC